jgi:hypothetical protein
MYLIAMMTILVAKNTLQPCKLKVKTYKTHLQLWFISLIFSFYGAKQVLQQMTSKLRMSQQLALKNLN